MKRSITYAFLLTVILAVIFIAGNPGSADPSARAISTFPYLLALLPIPLLVGALVLDTARGRRNEFSLLLGARVGERALSGHFTTRDGVELHYVKEGSSRPLVFVQADWWVKSLYV
jgi:hypothetical protein